MDNRKVILMIIPGLGNGGAERIYHHMTKVLADDYRVVEVFFNLEDQAYPVVSTEYYVLNPVRAKGYVDKVVNLYRRIVGLRKIKRSVRPDYSISLMDGADYLNIITRTRSEKVISYVHSSLVDDNNIKGVAGWMRRNVFIRYFYRWPDVVVTVSQGIEQSLRDFCGAPKHKYRTIYNYTDIPKVREMMREPVDPRLENVFSKHFSLVTCGRIEPEKNQRFLLQVFQRLHEQKGAVKLFLAGDGRLRASLTEYSRMLGLRTYSAADSDDLDQEYDVYFLGFQPNPFKFVTRAKWFVFTSLFEGLPLSLLESMACGTPVISTDCRTGPKEILSFSQDPVSIAAAPYYTDFGILMPPSDSEPMAQHIALWADTLARLEADASIGARYRAVQGERLDVFSADYWLQSWKDLFNALK